MSKFSVLRLSFALCSLSVLAGCQSYVDTSASRQGSLNTGDFSGAIRQANSDADKNKDNKDTVVFRLEQGSLLRLGALAVDERSPAMVDTVRLAALAPQPPLNVEGSATQPTNLFLLASLDAFNAAEEKIERYDEQAKLRVGSQTGAILTNQANLPYTGRDYDRIMMNLYKALNYMHLGDFDAARVELNRTLQRQRDAVAANAKRIEEAKELAEKARRGEVQDEQGRQGGAYDVNTARQDGRAGGAIASLEIEIDGRLKAYEDYVNPFAVFVDGLYFLYHAADGSDFERARMSFSRVLAMNPGHPQLQEEVAFAEATQGPERVTYVIFETGAAPHREQIRIDIPVGVLTNRISYVGAAFPKLQFNDNYVSVLSVNNGMDFARTGLVASMDSVVAQDFKNEWPSILTKTLISTATKAIIDAAIQNAVKDQGWQAQLAAKIITGIAQAATNIADTRTWRTLPKEFQYVRVENPENGMLSVSDGLSEVQLQVDPNAVNVVYVKSLTRGAPLVVSQFTLVESSPVFVSQVTP